MDSDDVGRWFGQYLDALAACGRGEKDAGSLLDYCGVPLLFATDDVCIALMSEEQVTAALGQQIEGMRAANYDHSDVLDSETTVLNATAAQHRATFSRQRRDGSEIGQLTVTYLVTDGLAGRRVSALAIHSA